MVTRTCISPGHLGLALEAGECVMSVRVFSKIEVCVCVLGVGGGCPEGPALGSMGQRGRVERLVGDRRHHVS